MRPWHVIGFLAAFLAIAAGAWSAEAPAVSQSTRQQQQLDATLAEALELCTEYFLPNSMARPPGFDINKHLAKVDTKRRRITRVFHNAAGVAFLEARISQDADDLRIVCMLQILAESRLDKAAVILQKDAGSTNEVVAENARRFLQEMQGK
jgi:hypothetical protein